MSHAADSEFVARLRALGPSDRELALREHVIAEFRRVLMLTPQETLATDQSFFDLGLTSLRLEEVKQSLEEALNRPVDADTLFNHPTIDNLLRHLREGPLHDVFGAAPAGPAATPAPADMEARLAQDLIERLMRGHG